MYIPSICCVQHAVVYTPTLLLSVGAVKRNRRLATKSSSHQTAFRPARRSLWSTITSSSSLGHHHEFSIRRGTFPQRHTERHVSTHVCTCRGGLVRREASHSVQTSLPLNVPHNRRCTGQPWSLYLPTRYLCLLH